VVSPSTDIGRTGVWERLDSAWTAWLTDRRADLPGAAPSPGLPAALEEAGFELVADEPLELVLDSPLDAPALRFANTTLERTRAQLGPYVDPADLTALDVLIDEGILRSNDTVLRASRRLTVAGVPEPDERIDERAPSRTRRDGEGTHLTGPASPGILQRGFSIDLGYWADAPERSGMRHRTLWAAGAAVAVVVAGGTGIAIAAGGDDDAQEVPITGAALERASAAALEHTGGGEVTGTEVGDEEGYYEVEITLDDGRQIDVHLDEGFDVLGDEADDETDDG
jgi:hypothetical protein